MMKNDGISEERWKNHPEEYLLTSTRYSDGLSIFHVPTRGVIIIEDDDWAEEVIEDMKRTGVKIVDVNSSYFDQFFEK